MMFRSLVFKWTATLILTSLIGVILAGIFSYRTTITEYDRLRVDQARATFVDNITIYYQNNDTWEGLEDWLRADQEDVDKSPGKHRREEQFALVDNDGIVIVGYGPFHTGESLPDDVLADGTPIIIDGELRATALLAQPPPDLDPREQLYVDNTNRALFIGAIGASATGLVVGLLLSRQFLKPLSELTGAIIAMRSGNLSQHVEIRTRDELGLLAKAFNEMSAQIARANQLRKQMTADIAHDLRTPLTVIAGYLEALTDGTLKPTNERFQAMNEEVNLLHRLVEDLRTLSLADAGELKLMYGTISASELLERVTVAFSTTAASANVELKVSVPDDMPDLNIDSERMVQVLGNLMTNSLRYTPAGGSVTLAAKQNGDYSQLIVVDTGAGIAAEDLPNIFERSYRADPSRHANSGESGLGLAIARSIVEAHGGKITVESTLGEGTTMTISLP